MNKLPAIDRYIARLVFFPMLGTLVLSAMRHFSAELVQRKIRVRYITLDDAENTGAFETEIAREVAVLKPSEIVCT